MAEGELWGPGGRPGLPVALGVHDPHPFVSREAELAALGERWRAAAAGRTQVVAIVGEPGIGKSRLARRFAQSAHDEGAIVLFGRCDEEPLERYQPLVEAARGLLTAGSVTDLPAEVGLLARLLPELAGDLPAADDEALADAETERYRLFEAFAALIRAAAKTAPVVLVIDDLHWADQPTLLLLRHLLRQPQPLALLVVATYRDTDVSRAHPLGELLADLRRDEALSYRVSLRGLDARAVERLLERLSGHELSDNGKALARELCRATGGNSFFIRETINHLVETDVLVQREDGRWVSAKSVEDVTIPDGVREVVMRRVGRLSEGAQRALVHASVIGPRFDVGLLAAILDEADTVVVDHLEEALEAQLVVEAADVVDEHTFVHALVRETLYATVSVSRRVRLHRAVGEALESRAGSTPPLADLARHFAEAPDEDGRAKALDYARRAAEQAMGALAYEAAASHLRRAIAVLGLIEGASAQGRAELLLALGRAQHLAERASDAQETFRLAAGLGRDPSVPGWVLADAALGMAGPWSDPGNPDREVVAMLEEALERIEPDDLTRRAHLLTRLSTELCYSQDGHSRALALGADAVRAAEAAGERVAITAARWYRRSMLAMPVDPEEREALGRETLRLATEAGDASGSMSGHGWLLLDHLQAGRIDEAGADIDAYNELLQRLRLPFRRWYPILWRATIALIEGRVEDAEALNTEALAMAGDGADALLFTNWSAQLFALRMLQGRGTELLSIIDDVVADKPGVVAWRAGLAYLLEEHGDRDQARKVYDEVVRAGLAALPYDSLWLVTLSFLAELAARFDDRRRATELRAMLEPFADAIVVVAYAAFCFGPVSLRLGLLAATVGDQDDAERHLRSALAKSASMGAGPWAATAALELATLLDQRARPGDADEARRLRADALTAADAGGWPVLAHRAKSTGPPRRSTPVSPW